MCSWMFGSEIQSMLTAGEMNLEIMSIQMPFRAVRLCVSVHRGSRTVHSFSIGHWRKGSSSRNRREVSSGLGRWPKGHGVPGAKGRRPVGQVSVNSSVRCHWRIKCGADEGVIIYSGSVEGLVILLSMVLVEWQS